MGTFSDYIVYVDESGDHGLVSIDPQYPVFVLAFCLFEKTEYSQQAVPHLQELKFKHFGHDMVILHEREIRKAENEFALLHDANTRRVFMEDLAELVRVAPFRLVASAIRKRDLLSQYPFPENPYELAMGFGLERINMTLTRKGVSGTTFFVFESRGKKEDAELELAFRRICDGRNYAEERFPFDIRIVDKKCNSCGLQIADLVARPIGRHLLAPQQTNRAYEVIQGKLDSRGGGEIEGVGLKVFP